LYAQGTLADRDTERALTYFSKACELRFQAGCLNLLSSGPYTQAAPRALDLRLLLREGGRNLIEMPEPELYARACEHAWTFACARTSQ
jgi:TPR repeat protein